MLRANSESLVIAVYTWNVVHSVLIYEASSSFYHLNLVDPASSHTLVLKIKPCMSKCFVFVTLDCRRLIITVIVLLRLLCMWIPTVKLWLIHEWTLFLYWAFISYQTKMLQHCGWFIVMLGERFKYVTHHSNFWSIS